ncbi:hypothetical protein [Nostoc sp. FACHB-280]|uniref:hypothetical protein n=1 Tax=Nostoc sp. FACHB-280 TaxID=2692839 RepID=UPI00168A7CA6|nr:hypothetical protein [Nostoc sp. FACHB-280]MBD2494863.1 hypothetical protein [Nostoc sp. FACHB-280]
MISELTGVVRVRKASRREAQRKRDRQEVGSEEWALVSTSGKTHIPQGTQFPWS